MHSFPCRACWQASSKRVWKRESISKALALLLLPPGDDGPFPTPVLLVPVSDYDKFVGQFQPQPLSADLTQVEIGGAPDAQRKLGGYAAITKTTCREILEKDLKVSAQIPPALAAWQAWLGQNDVSTLILPAGVTQFSRQGQQFLQMMKATIAAVPNMPPQAKLGFDVYLQFLQAIEKEVAAVGLGLQLDSHHVLRLAGRMLPVPGQKLEQILQTVPPANENLLAGLPADPFAMAFAVATTPALRQAITDYSLAMMKSATRFVWTQKRASRGIGQGGAGMDEPRPGLFHGNRRTPERRVDVLEHGGNHAHRGCLRLPGCVRQ